MSTPIIGTESLTRRFGALAAVGGVTLSFLAGETHALIGPNGAGKTTMLNLLSGELLPTSGRILFNGRDVTGWTPDRLSQAGLGRSFQHSSVLEDMTVLENVRLAAQSRMVGSIALLRNAHASSAPIATARDTLRRVGLDQAAEEIAGSLSHGAQRQLEIAMLLATGPRVLLLDEPTAGMSRVESHALTELLRQLKTDHTIVLVEHDMQVVFDIADRVTVMTDGQVLASGAPEAVRSDANVRKAYLGERSARTKTG